MSDVDTTRPDETNEPSDEAPEGCISTEDIATFSLILVENDGGVEVFQSYILEWTNHILDCSSCLARLLVARAITRHNPSIEEDEVVASDQDLLRRGVRADV